MAQSLTPVGRTGRCLSYVRGCTKGCVCGVFSWPEEKSQSLRKMALNNLTHKPSHFLTCPGIGLTGPWCINTPFTHNRHSILDISSKRRPYMSQIRCSGAATFFHVPHPYENNETVQQQKFYSGKIVICVYLISGCGILITYHITITYVGTTSPV